MHAPMRPATSYNVAIGSSSAASTTPVSAGIRHVLLVATSACYVKFGTAPTADTSTSMMLPPNWPQVFVIRPGEVIAAIQVSASGTLNVTELTS